MKKVFLIATMLVLFVAAMLVGTAYWFGVLAEGEYYKILKQASKSAYAEFTNKSYNRGFFKSTARAVIEIRQPGARIKTGVGRQGEESEQIILVHDIRHGPFLLGKSLEGRPQMKPVLGIIETRVELDHDTKGNLQKILDLFSGKSSIEHHTTFYLGGNGETRLVIPAFRQMSVIDDKVSVNWEGLTAQSTFTSGFKGFKGSISIPGFEAVGKDGSFKIEDMQSYFDIHEGISGLSLGNVSFNIANLEFEAKHIREGKRYSINGTEIVSSSREQDNTVTCSFTTRIEQMMIDNCKYGPGGFELEFRKIDAVSLSKLRETYRNIQTRLPYHSQEDIRHMMFTTYLEVLNSLMKKSPEIELKQLSIKTNDGTFSGRAIIAFKGSDAAFFNNPLLLLNAVAVHVEFTVTDRLLQSILESIDRAKLIEASKTGGFDLNDEQIIALAAAETSARLKTMVERNILVHENGIYKVNANYNQGQIILNGRSISFQEFVQ